MNRARATSVGIAAALALVLGACTPQAPQPPQPPVGSWQDQMVASINSFRAAEGLPPLTRCATLDVAAQNHSQDQANRNTMSHIGGDGSTMVTRADRAGYTGWRSLAENVAYGQGDVTTVMRAWMNSPGHRANILGGSTHVGVGLARSSNGTPYWTQDYGSGGRC